MPLLLRLGLTSNFGPGAIDNAHKSMTKIRLGILGLGHSGLDLHLSLLREMPEFTVVAACDPVPERLARAAGMVGCRTYTRPEQLFADPDVDICVVAVLPSARAKYARKSLQAAKHTIVDGPACVSVEVVDALFQFNGRPGAGCPSSSAAGTRLTSQLSWRRFRTTSSARPASSKSIAIRTIPPTSGRAGKQHPWASC